MKSTSRFTRFLSTALCVLMLVALPACGASAETAAIASGNSILSAGADDEKHQEQIFSMDTIMTLTAYGANGPTGLKAAEKSIYALNDLLDPQVETSDIYKVNAAGGNAVEVSAVISDMIRTAQKVYGQTGGALDITVLPVVELWGFLDENFHVPADEDIQEALTKLCFDQLELDGSSIRIPETAAITLGAVAKGCTANIVIDEMANAGVTSGIISLGGNIQTLGVKPDGRNWTVAVQDPNNPAFYCGTLSIGQLAVVTSGTYQRYFEENGQKYHHIIDPETGYPSDNELLSVTILTEDGTLADCLSTAMFVLGTDKALDYWRTYGNVEGEEFEMILINKDHQITCTPGAAPIFTLVDTSYTVSVAEA